MVVGRDPSVPHLSYVRPRRLVAVFGSCGAPRRLTFGYLALAAGLISGAMLFGATFAAGLEAVLVGGESPAGHLLRVLRCGTA
ncbi:hypothetical protein MCNS_32090 [Mycobacterium conspicuum]|uniref:Uncharacterized protein n=1 Tax=Mycobacterium conspicuum TaxID=44010 RepID=A0A7I7YEJ0_9MYCO|nr:hypothetical protein MCNS_32090 [Mycobacterium conspicuum]